MASPVWIGASAAPAEGPDELLERLLAHAPQLNAEQRAAFGVRLQRAGYAVAAPAAAPGSLEERLMKLKAAFDAQIITEDEYKQKRATLLANF